MPGELYAAIFDAVPDHIALLDSNGKILTVNRGWREFANKNGFHGLDFTVGNNYLEICDGLQGGCSGESESGGARHPRNSFRGTRGIQP